MKQEFVPYEESLELKELKFDEECFAWYAETKNLQISLDVYKKWTSKPCNNSNIIIVFNSDCVTAPTYSQAFRWFREKYGLCLVIKPIDDKKLALGYTLLKNGLIMSVHLTYKEAELACLKKLIEIATP
jgi:hypothetical protein